MAGKRSDNQCRVKQRIRKDEDNTVDGCQEKIPFNILGRLIFERE